MRYCQDDFYKLSVNKNKDIHAVYKKLIVKSQNNIP